MALTTRLFSAADTVNLWELLNEVKGWIDQLNGGGAGSAARYWTGHPAQKSLADGRNVSVAMSTQDDSAGSVVPVWNGDAFALPAGRYRIDLQVRFDYASGGYRTVSLMKNAGVTTYNSSTGQPGTYLRSAQYAASSNDTTVQLTWLGTLAASDALLVIARQTSGTTTNVLGTAQDSSLMIERLGD